MLNLTYSPMAKKDIEAISIYYNNKGGKKVVNKIFNSISDSVDLLTTQPNLGYIEPDLGEFPQCFRCLINVPNYKIIYWIENETVKVATIFDCRQQPQQLYYLLNTRTDWVCEPQVEYIKTQK